MFPDFYFRENRPEKCFLPYSRRKKPFLDYKNKKLKKSKNWDFPKGKLVIFSDFYLRENRPEKCVLRYSRRKKRLSRL